MFGITLLTETEKKEHIRIKRINQLQSLIEKEGAVRRLSLSKAEAYTKELDTLTQE
jgi:hypothetical protein